MGDITYNRVYKESLNLVKGMIESKLVDPKGRSKKKIIHTSRQHSSSLDFCGYPYIVVYLENVRQEEPANDRSNARVYFEFLIEVIGQSKDTSAFDSVSNQIIEIFDSKSNRFSLSSSGLSGCVIEDSPVSEEVDGVNKLFVREIRLNFNRRLSLR